MVSAVYRGLKLDAWHHIYLADIIVKKTSISHIPLQSAASELFLLVTAGREQYMLMLMLMLFDDQSLPINSMTALTLFLSIVLSELVSFSLSQEPLVEHDTKMVPTLIRADSLC